MDRKALQDALMGLGRIPDRGPLPILNGIHMDIRADKATLTRTDLELSYRVTVEHEGEPFQAVFPDTKKLKDFCKAYKGDRVTFGYDDHRIKVNGTLEVSETGTADDYPAWSKHEPQETSEVGLTQLVEDLRRVTYAASTDEDRFSLHGILLDGDSGRMVATDGHRLVIRKVDWLPGEGRWLLPKTSAQWILKTWGTKKRLRDNPTVTIGFDRRSLSFDLEHETFLARLIDGDYPDYRKVMRNTGKGYFACDRKTMIRSLETVLPMTTDRNRGAKFSFTSGALQVEASHPDMGTAHTTIETEISKGYQGADNWIMNVCYLIEALQTLACKAVCVDIEKEGPALILNGHFPEADWEQWPEIHLLMPMRK